MRKFLLLLVLIANCIMLQAQHGANDPTFNPIDLGLNREGPNGNVYMTKELSNGQIMIAGDFTSYNGVSRNRIARLNSDGTLDESFDPMAGPNGAVHALLLFPDGSMLIGGTFGEYNGESRRRIAKINDKGQLDNTFDVGFGFDNNVFALSWDLNGNILVGGDFTSYNGRPFINRITRLLPNGIIDPAFNNVFLGPTHYITSIGVQSNGRIIIAGFFSQYNGVSANGIAGLNSDGSLDNNFLVGTGATGGGVQTLQVVTNDEIIIGGFFTNYKGVARNRIAKLDANGDLVTAFNTGTGANDAVYTIALQQPGNKILIGGRFTNYNGRPNTNRIARLNDDGTLDNIFSSGSGADDIISKIEVLSTGKLLIAGHFNTYNGISRRYLLRLNTDGQFDVTFNTKTGADNELSTLALDATGNIYVAGYFSSYNGVPRIGIARLHNNGSLDADFDSRKGIDVANFDNIKAIAPLNNGKVLIGGSFRRYDLTPIVGIARLNNNGSLDNTFNETGTGLDGNVYAIVPLSNGDMLIGGSFTTYNGVSRNGIVKLDAEGNLLTSFDPGSGINNGGSISALAVQADGKIIIGGWFNEYNGVNRNGIARLHSDGSLDTEFNPAGVDVANGQEVYSIAVQPDGKIIIGGWFTKVNGADRNYMARLNTDGSLDNAFDQGTGADNQINSILLQADGKLIIGGNFTSYNDANRRYIARLNIDGSLDNSFDPGTGADNIVNTLALQSDGKIVIGGVFLSYNGTPRTRIARLQAGSLVTGTIAPTTYCAGSTVSVPYIATGNYQPGNLFRAELSDAAGSFATPVEIGTLLAEGSGTINATLPANTPAGTGYRIRVTSNAPALIGSTNTIDIVINALPATPVVTASGNTTVCAGGTVVLTSDAANGNQWYRNGILITGATGQTYTATESGSYTVVVTANSCSSASSTAIDVTVNPIPAAPSVTAGGTTTFCGSGSVTLTSNAATGNQWYRDNILISGATNATFTATQAGSYTVQVTTNGCTSQPSVATVVSVTPLPTPPTVTAGGTTFCDGGNVVLTSSAASGNQWFRNGVAINGATNATFTATQSGDYTVVTTVNNCSSAPSAATTVTVTPRPGVPVITQNGNVLTSPATTGNQWLLNGTPIQGATNQTYTVQASGSYTVRVTQNNCTNISAIFNFVATSTGNPVNWSGEIFAYPNPVEGTLFLKNTNGRKVQVIIYDITGKKVHESKLLTSSGTINMMGLPKGVYTLQITDLGNQETIHQQLLKH